MPLKDSIRIEFYSKSIMERIYALHGNRVDADRTYVAKASTKHLEPRLEVIQGHAFWITEKPTRDCLLMYNNVGRQITRLSPDTIGDREREMT